MSSPPRPNAAAPRRDWSHASLESWVRCESRGGCGGAPARVPLGLPRTCRKGPPNPRRTARARFRTLLASALAGAQAPCWLSGRRGERDEGERRGPKSSPPCTCGRFHAATGSLGDPCGGAGRWRAGRRAEVQNSRMVRTQIRAAQGGCGGPIETRRGRRPARRWLRVVRAPGRQGSGRGAGPNWSRLLAGSACRCEVSSLNSVIVGFQGDFRVRRGLRVEGPLARRAKLR